MNSRMEMDIVSNIITNELVSLSLWILISVKIVGLKCPIFPVF